MLAKIFGKNSYLNLGYAVAFLLIYYCYVIFFEHSTRVDRLDFLENSLVISLGVLFLIANYFVPRKYLLTSKNDYHILALTVLMIAFDSSLFDWKVLASNLCLMVTFQKIYRLPSASDARKILFDASFFLGIASLFSFWSCLFAICVLASIFFSKFLNIKTLLIIILGICSPIVLFLSFQFAFNHNSSLYEEINLLEIGEFNFNMYESKLLLYILFMLALIVSVVFSLLKNMKGSFIPFKTLRLLIVHVFISLGIFCVSIHEQGTQILFLLMPASIFISNQISIIGKKHRNIAITCFVSTLLLAKFIQSYI